MARTPLQKPLPHTPSKTPQSRKHLHFPSKHNASMVPSTPAPSPAPSGPTEHPVEVVGRIRDYPDRKTAPSSSSLEVAGDGRSIRVRTEIGYRDFALDGVSASEDEDLELFYRKFVGSRIEGVRMGGKCTVMMYGPTGSGKSHTMFGFGKQPGILYRALRDILGGREGEEEGDNGGFGHGLFVQVAVLEIYNEEIYDLLSGNLNGGANIGPPPPKGSTFKVRLEVIGKKAKNATQICGNEAGKLSRELIKVEKRRIVKCTQLNERSSRSHCMIILDVPSVGGRLILVDMAGSENFEQAGQIGLEAKMQTAKINQGNVALKRVVECIANSDSHVPFRDSKLTMLLQDSFEDDKSKILMILCASPDPKEMHKTICTLEYGAKAKCIVRVAHIPTPRDKTNNEESCILLRSRIVAMNQFICKLQEDIKVKERACGEANRELLLKEEEVACLRARIQLIEGRGVASRKEEIESMVSERTKKLRLEIMALEEKMSCRDREISRLTHRVKEMESEKLLLPHESIHQGVGAGFMKRLSEVYTEGNEGMEKSMELDFVGDHQPIVIHDVKEIREHLYHQPDNNTGLDPSSNQQVIASNDKEGDYMPRCPNKLCLSTVIEGDCEGEDREESKSNIEVDKEVVVVQEGNWKHAVERSSDICSDHEGVQNTKDAAMTRRTTIENIFRLCGDHRQLAQHIGVRNANDVEFEPSSTTTPHSKEFNSTQMAADSNKTRKASADNSPASFSSWFTEEGKSARSGEQKENHRTKCRRAQSPLEKVDHIPFASLENIPSC